MGCCGQKRQELNSFEVHPQLQDANNVQVYDQESNHLSQNNATFRYTGDHSLRVKSFLNHRVYDFSSSDPELTVMAEDVAMMRGYPALVELNIT